MGIFTTFLQKAEILLYKLLIFNRYPVPEWIANFFSKKEVFTSDELILNGKATLENDLAIWRNIAHLPHLLTDFSKNLEDCLTEGNVYLAYIKVQMGTKVTSEIPMNSEHPYIQALDNCKFLRKYDSKNKFIPWKQLINLYLTRPVDSTVCDYLVQNFEYVFSDIVTKYLRPANVDNCSFNEFIKACIKSLYTDANTAKSMMNVYKRAPSKDARIMFAKWYLDSAEANKKFALLDDIVKHKDNIVLMQYFAEKVGIFKLKENDPAQNIDAIAKAYFVLEEILKANDKLCLASYVLCNMSNNYVKLIKLFAEKKNPEILTCVIKHFFNSLKREDLKSLSSFADQMQYHIGDKCALVIKDLVVERLNYLNETAKSRSRIQDLNLTQDQFLNILNVVVNFNGMSSTTLSGPHFDLVEKLANHKEFRGKWCVSICKFSIESDTCTKLLSDVEKVMKGQALTI